MELLEAETVRAWAQASRAALAASRDRIDAVNVFPVPDSDTGTNVLLTVTGGFEALEALPVAAGQDAHDVASAFARGALRAARGNSGVILSQYLTGFARALPARPGAAEVADALGAAGRSARGSMREPQEGTVLTLADVVARSAQAAVGTGADLPTMLRTVVADAHVALARISAVHPVLRAARVVDAGACALLVVLDALAGVVSGLPDRADRLDWLPVGPVHPWPIEPAGGAFEVMLLVSADGPGTDLGAGLQASLAAVGDSVAVVGADGWWHVHVHTDDPAAAIAAARPGGIGRREQVLVRLVDAAHAGGTRVGDDQRWGVVVCTAAPALAGWYASTGAVTVVRCPEASVQVAHLRRAVADTGAAQVAVLAGDAVERSPLATLVGSPAPGVRVEVVDGDDELAVAVAALALAGASASDAGLRSAHLALGRLRAVTLDGDVTALALGGAAGSLVRSTPGHGESLTVVVRDAPSELLLAELTAYLAAHHPGVEPTLVGPTGHGPAALVGLD